MNKNTTFLAIIAVLLVIGGLFFFLRHGASSPEDRVSATALPTNGLVGDTTAERVANPNNPNAQKVPALSEQVPPPPPAGAPVPPPNPVAAIPPMSTAPAPTPTIPINPANDPLASMGPGSTGPITAGSINGAQPAPPPPGAITAGIPPSTAVAPQPQQQLPNNVVVVVHPPGFNDDVPPGAEVTGENPQAPANMPARQGMPPITPGEGQ